MRRVPLLLLVGLFLAACSAVLFADRDPAATGHPRFVQDDGDQYDAHNGDPSVDAITAVNNAINNANSSLPTGSPSPGKGEGCVGVTIALPDSVVVDSCRPYQSFGTIELTNCGDSPALVFVTFQATINLPGILDTVLTFPPRMVPMLAGQKITHPINLVVPPLAGTYILCATAVSGSFSATGCDTTVVVSAIPSGFPIHAWGVLVQGTGCVVFHPLHWCQQHAFSLDNYGGFVAGDTVYVAGGLVPHCQTTCLEANGCIRNNTINGQSPNPGVPFQGCGVVLPGNGCLLFRTFTEQYPNLFAIENPESLQVGDSVCLHGTVVPNCQLPCPEAQACLGNVTVDPPNPSGPIRVCGVLVQGAGCVLLQAPCEGTDRYLLDNYGVFGVGDTVCVAGMLAWGCNSICPEAIACIHDNDIWPNPQDTIHYSGCGVLVETMNCLLFLPDGVDSLGLMLQNYGGFGPGDSVCVAGILQNSHPGMCQDATGYLANNSITGSNHPNPQYSACGVLLEVNASCLVFAPQGLDSMQLALQNYGNFGPGDVVCVQGVLLNSYPGMCSAATGFLANNTITGANNPQQPIDACGELVQGGTCVLFHPTGLPGAVLLLLENYGSFGVGDSVCVQGVSVVGTPPTCPWASATVINNTITGSNSQRPFDACGELVQGGACVLFHPARLPGAVLFLLENYGDFGVGDSVCVHGTSAFEAPPACPWALATVINNTIGPADSLAPALASNGTLSASNYPNPFNPMTKIQFELAQAGLVTVSVYNSLGQVVKVLVDGMMSAGIQQLVWDGTDDVGRGVASGIYFYRIDTNGISETRKMLLMK